MNMQNALGEWEVATNDVPPSTSPPSPPNLPTATVANDVKWLRDEYAWLANLRWPGIDQVGANRNTADGVRLGEIANRYEALLKEAEKLRSDLAAAQVAQQTAQASLQQVQTQITNASLQQPASTTAVVTQPKSNTGLVVAGVAIFAGLVGVGVWWWYRNQKMAGAREGGEGEVGEISGGEEASEPPQLMPRRRTRRTR